MLDGMTWVIEFSMGGIAPGGSWLQKLLFESAQLLGDGLAAYNEHGVGETVAVTSTSAAFSSFDLVIDLAENSSARAKGFLGGSIYAAEEVAQFLLKLAFERSSGEEGDAPLVRQVDGSFGEMADDPEL